MNLTSLARAAAAGSLALVVLASCGNFSGLRSDGLTTENELARRQAADAQRAAIAEATGEDEDRETIWNLFENRDDPNTTVEVNKYLWQSSLEILNFLPIETVDPFTGIIVTGYGTPPGGGRAYRATIHVSDPALDARALRVSLQGRDGAAVSPETQRAVEDAILTRARQLRIRDIGL
ncbi:MAG TPA: DUF3576 domain-containing protein [Gemmobacter sp.]|nr:DUF3576 domain-containing protein [Gemmobacter sp.]